MSGSSSTSGQSHTDVSDTLAASSSQLAIPDGLTIDTDDFVSSIELRFWSRLAKLSWRPFPKPVRSFTN